MNTPQRLGDLKVEYMAETTHSVKYRKDYQPYHFTINEVMLDFQLMDAHTRVTATTKICRNPKAIEHKDTLFLHGEGLKLISIKINNIDLRKTSYAINSSGIELFNVPDDFELYIETEIDPDNNTSLEGLYRSSGNYCTQCEAEGFRKITYFLDRPDVMARFTTRIEADADKYPVMLSNGNLIDSGKIGTKRHFVVWEDPFPKPSYLFALVAGNLIAITDTYETLSKREVRLEIYVEERNRDYCAHAMESLKKSMKWDEDVYGLAYDLDTYMIVAVDDFNMGAMENKGLNIFNSKYVLASTQTATDQDYLGVEGVIAHEYFHNWTGNRVTCRDWFQLSLKEGLTVFRDQEFSSDMNSRAVQRIDDVKILRDYQFREDAGPMAHSVRPDSYVEINNFYTVTVYNKGAEVIRMIHTLLGPKKFRQGMDLYFKRHDGQAVTCDDFAAAMADASEVDLSQFKRWYSQAGTPELTVEQEWNRDNGEFNLVITQECADTPGQDAKQPFHIPLRVGLLGQNGEELIEEEVLQFKWAKQKFSFKDLKEKPVLSFNRGFSAPVKITSFQSFEDLSFLMAHDNDQFNRWEAAQTLATDQILKAMEDIQEGREVKVNELFIEGIKVNLTDSDGDRSLIAQAITMPSEMYLTQQIEEIEPHSLNQARKEIIYQISNTLKDDFFQVLQELQEPEQYSLDNESIGRRRLRNCCLSYLMSQKDIPDTVIGLCHTQYLNSTNMTDQIAALRELANLEDSSLRDECLLDFYTKWKHDPLVMDKWFILQATSSRKHCLDDVVDLMVNPCFSLDNPNKVRALIGAFCSGNHIRFHEKAGKGYHFLADQIIKLNARNPQIAARLLTPLTAWKKYHPNYSVKMREQLERISKTENISPDVYEIVRKSL